MRKLSVVWIIALLALAALPATAADRVIYNGVDLWNTPGGGTTFADFSRHPLPAGFFCEKSEPFTGRIVFRGVPVATGTPGALGKTDTIVQRLDDAVFNKNGVAATRIQVRAMAFESVAPVATACGAFNVKVTLDGEQPITQMRVFTDGRFLAPISVNVKIGFTPVVGPARELLEIRKSLRFPAQPKARWTAKFAADKPAHPGVILVDTDGDRVPDTYIPGTSNFAAGVQRTKTLEDQPVMLCHITDDCSHCTG
ncbi:MAG: hypothetical protein JF614_20855 [Acidobacteria bacterium]|nr:hypothetical protein [Acidobacteriota bacterium]